MLRGITPVISIITYEDMTFGGVNTLPSYFGAKIRQKNEMKTIYVIKN
jgi:hypothetical protein